MQGEVVWQSGERGELLRGGQDRGERREKLRAGDGL